MELTPRPGEEIRRSLFLSPIEVGPRKDIPSPRSLEYPGTKTAPTNKQELLAALPTSVLFTGGGQLFVFKYET